MKSFFLFGPRATGKTTLIRQQLSEKATIIDLLDSRYFLRLSADPHELESVITATPADIIVIDEIQRIPELLNEVHRLIESKQLTFLLTGSSARKLRRGRANLLAGRVWNAGMFPLIYREIPDFNLARYLRYGGLPAVYLSAYPEEELDAYVNTYLKEEGVFNNFILVSQDPISTRTDDILTVPWQKFLSDLWEDKFV